TPPLAVTVGTHVAHYAEIAAEVELQALDNNDRPIGQPETHVVSLDLAEGAGLQLDDLRRAVEGVLRLAASPPIPAEAVLPALHQLDAALTTLCDEVRAERNRLREKRREVRERTQPPWLAPLLLRLRAFLEALSEGQYDRFLAAWGLTDEALGR